MSQCIHSPPRWNFLWVSASSAGRFSSSQENLLSCILEIGTMVMIFVKITCLHNFPISDHREEDDTWEHKWYQIRKKIELMKDMRIIHYLKWKWKWLKQKWKWLLRRGKMAASSLFLFLLLLLCPSSPLLLPHLALVTERVHTLSSYTNQLITSR